MIEQDFSAFNPEDFCGWYGDKDKDLLKEIADQYGQNQGEYRQLNIIGQTATKQRVMLYEIVRNILGKDTDNYPQAIGDCTSFGGKNCSEYLQCVQIALGDRFIFKPIHPCYIYGCSRVLIGKGQLGRTEGGFGQWVQDSVKTFGDISLTDDDAPPYSGNIATQWGNNGPPQKFVTIGKQNLVGSTAKIQSWTDIVSALSNGYPISVCSNRGFAMGLDSQGFNAAQGTWAHCMTFIGFDEGDDKVPAHVCLLNSWGDMFGRIKDWRTGEMWPVGTLRIRKQDAIEMLAQDDTYSFSDLEGFPAKTLPESYFSSFN